MFTEYKQMCKLVQNKRNLLFFFAVNCHFFIVKINLVMIYKPVNGLKKRMNHVSNIDGSDDDRINQTHVF